MISVIMTVYNESIYLFKEACYSVMDQTFDDLEFIIVNDGSTNKYISPFLSSFETEWKEKRSYNDILIIDQSNTGHSEAMNVGMNYAKGEYFFFIDSDDLITNDCLTILYQNLIKTGSDISIGACMRTVTSDSLFEMQKSQTNITLHTLNFLQSVAHVCKWVNVGNQYFPGQMDFIATWNKIFKREVFMNPKNPVRFPTGYMRDDNFTAHRLFYNAKKVVKTNKITYLYRKGGRMAGNNLYKNTDLILAHEDRLNFLKDIRNEFNEKEQIILDTIYANEYAWYLYTLVKTHNHLKYEEEIQEKIRKAQKEEIRILNDLQETYNKNGLLDSEEMRIL